jgi:benzoyl-CoA reductase subunit BamC
MKVKKTKIIRQIEIDIDKCTGCRVCESVCSAYHYEPKYSLSNPARSRIRVFFDEENDVYVPMKAGPYTEAECEGRKAYTINGRKYEECQFCPVSCPSRPLFREPDSDIPLKCDMCGDPPPPEGPLCVAWCLDDALTYTEREEEVEEEENLPDEKEAAIEYLINQYGIEEIIETLNRKSGG